MGSKEPRNSYDVCGEDAGAARSSGYDAGEYEGTEQEEKRCAFPPNFVILHLLTLFLYESSIAVSGNVC